tara:strand:+ start:263 stop:484 length:222 start_codon:yes stop_codon:yes gene_type:complete
VFDTKTATVRQAINRFQIVDTLAVDSKKPLAIFGIESYLFKLTSGRIDKSIVRYVGGYVGSFEPREHSALATI